MPTLLDSGNSGVSTGTTSNATVTVTSGDGNRKLIVGVAAESSANTDVSSITFDGQSLSAVASSGANPDSFARVEFYELLEADMPANGDVTLAVTWTSGTGDKAAFFWLVDDCDQSASTGAANSASSGGGSGTTISTSISASDASAFLAAVGYKNNTTGTMSLTSPGSSTTDADLSGDGSGDRLAGGHKNGSLTAGSNTVTWTMSSEARRAVSAVVAEPNSGVDASQAAFASGPSSASATGSVAEQVSQAAFVSGASSASAAGTFSDVVASQSVFVSGASSASTTGTSASNASAAAFTSGASSASASGQVAVNASAAAFTSGAASFSASGSAAANVPGDVVVSVVSAGVVSVAASRAGEVTVSTAPAGSVRVGVA